MYVSEDIGNRLRTAETALERWRWEREQISDALGIKGQDNDPIAPLPQVLHAIWSFKRSYTDSVMKALGRKRDKLRRRQTL